MNVDIFGQYIFSRIIFIKYPRKYVPCENNFYNTIIPHTVKKYQNVTINQREIANFQRCAKM